MSKQFGVAVLVAALACANGPASAAFSTIYAFGDSLSDAGNAYIGDGGTDPVSPPYFLGRFSNGPTWVEDLSVKLGLGTLEPSLLGGNDFAVGGAQTGPTPVNPANPLPVDLSDQIVAFGHADPKPVAGALYTLDIGANDIGDALEAFATHAIDFPTLTSDIAQAETNTIDAVQALYADGARNLLYYEVPDLGVVPAFEPFAPLAALGVSPSELAKQFNDAVLAGIAPLEAEGLKVFDLPIYSQIDQIVGDPKAFGFTNVDTPCWTGSSTDPTSGAVCSALPAVQNQYLFWDSEHPTEAGQLLVADLAYPLVAPEPSTWAMMLAGFAGLGFAGWRARRVAQASLA